MIVRKKNNRTIAAHLSPNWLKDLNNKKLKEKRDNELIRKVKIGIT